MKPLLLSLGLINIYASIYFSYVGKNDYTNFIQNLDKTTGSTKGSFSFRTNVTHLILSEVVTKTRKASYLKSTYVDIPIGGGEYETEKVIMELYKIKRPDIVVKRWLNYNYRTNWLPNDDSHYDSRYYNYNEASSVLRKHNIDLTLYRTTQPILNIRTKTVDQIYCYGLFDTTLGRFNADACAFTIDNLASHMTFRPAIVLTLLLAIVFFVCCCFC